MNHVTLVSQLMENLENGDLVSRALARQKD